MEYIRVKNLKKQYDEKAVVDGIDLSINKGEILGILGPNGAGKTTTIGMLSAQIEKTGGSITIDGMEVKKDDQKIKSIVGIVPQEIALYDVLSANENLEFFGSLYGLWGKELQEKIKWILKLVGLEDRAKEEVGKYSGGMKRRINIAAAILHNPKVVFMDEPTVGIDPQSRNKILELVKLLKEQGMTIIYTTHYMEEATILCDRLVIIDNGKVILSGETQELIKMICDGVIELVINNKEEHKKAISIIKEFKLCSQYKITNNKISIIVKDMQNSMSKIMDKLLMSNVEVNLINTMPPTLETLFLYLTGKSLRE